MSRWLVLLGPLGLALLLGRESWRYYERPLRYTSEQFIRGSAAPPYSGLSLSGDSLRLTNLRGKVVLLNVWDTSCTPCVRELPQLERLHRQFARSGLEVIGVSIDSEPGARVAAFLRAAGVTYPNLLDSRRRLAEEFGVRAAIPQTFLLDRKGIVVQHRYGGPMNRAQEAALTDTIRALLASS
jgi:peroxiredoxin